MFLNDKTCSGVELPELSKSSANPFLEFIYTGKFTADDLKILLELLACSDKVNLI
jgi:hypothetical protein